VGRLEEVAMRMEVIVQDLGPGFYSEFCRWHMHALYKLGQDTFEVFPELKSRIGGRVLEIKVTGEEP